MRHTCSVQQFFVGLSVEEVVDLEQDPFALEHYILMGVRYASRRGSSSDSAQSPDFRLVILSAGGVSLALATWDGTLSCTCNLRTSISFT
jgi:hypothetical protein